MRPVRLLAAVCTAVLAIACGGEPPDEAEDDIVPGPAVDPDNAKPDIPDQDDTEASTAPDAPPAPDAPGQQMPSCKKKLTVLFTVGVPGKSKMKTNGCWTPLIADGASVQSFRKCSTSNYQVVNPDAPNWAYDDTNIEHPLAKEKDFVARCSKGATGDGYEYIYYRGAWRFVPALGLRAYFAELYGSTTTDLDGLYYVNGVYRGNAALAQRKNVYPMMNFGPPKAANMEKKVRAEALKICKTITDGGYFGMYNASWREGMEANDPRLLALQSALGECTAM